MSEGEVSIVNILLAAQGYIAAAREEANGSGEPGAAREFSIAITAVEDAIMRTNRGFAIQKGIFAIGDVQTKPDEDLD
jgi:hypothetical protein